MKAKRSGVRGVVSWALRTGALSLLFVLAGYESHADPYMMPLGSESWPRDELSGGGVLGSGEIRASDAALERGFGILESLGNAANGGSADEEGLRQACALLDERGSAALEGALEERFRNRSLLSGMSGLSGLSDTRIGSVVFARGQGAVEGALSGAVSSACASLTGQGGGAGLGSGFDPAQLKSLALGLAAGQGLDFLRSSGLPFTGRVEVTGGLMSGGGSGWEVLSVQPLWHDASERHHVFTQLSWNRTLGRRGYAEGDTLNAGLAYRRLSANRSVVYGVNAFLDHARTLNHNRASVGADMQTARLGVSFNRYLPLSSWKSVDDYTEERASGGWDLQLQGRVPSLPSWQVNATGYEWSSNEDKERAKTFGYDLGLAWQPVNALIWEAGLRNEQDAAPELHTQMRLIYRFGEPWERMWQAPAPLTDMGERVYDKVRRDNAMRVEQRTKESAYVRVTQSAGANIARLASGAAQGLSAGQQLPLPFMVSVSSAAGSVVRLSFRSGAILTIGAGSSVRAEATRITLLAGSFQYVSGATNVTISVPGGVVTLLGTDVDVSTDGTTSVLRVREGRAVLAGTSSGSATLDPGEAADAVSGVVGAALASNDPVYISHTDKISQQIDLVATPQDGVKIAPYPIEAPRLITASTTPGDPVVIGLKFNTAVSVSGTPRLVLDINGTSRYADYTGGSGTDDLSFTYTLLPADAGASSVRVDDIELNGGTVTAESKNAVITIADTVLSLNGSVSDVTAPAGYAVAFTTDPITDANKTAAAFQITGAEVGTTYDYTITSSGDGDTAQITGSNTIATAAQNVTGIDVSSLPDGTLTLSLTLTDASANTGAAATDTVAKNTIALALDFAGGTYSLNGTSAAAFTALTGATFARASAGYAQDSAGNWVQFNAGEPRITDQGLLIEDSRKNDARNSALGGAAVGVIGSGGALPTGWTVAAYAGITREVVALGTTSDGIPYIDIRISGTNATGATIYPDINPTAGGFRPAAASGQTWTASLYTAVVAGSRAGFQTSLNRVTVAEYNAVNGYLTGTTDSSGLTSWRRSTATRTFSNGATVYAGLYISMSISNGSTVDCTVRVGFPQLEKGSYASSPILTSGAAVTRDADVATITTGSWYNAAEGTLVAEAVNGLGSNTVGIAAINNSATPLSDRIALIRTGVTTLEFAVLSGGVSQFQPTSAFLGDNSANKMALAYKQNDFRGAVNGTLSPADASGDIPTVDRLVIGTWVGTAYYSGYIKNIEYYGTRKSDTDLQALTTP